MRLETEKISKSYGGIQALKDVSVSFVDGEIHALIGENGSGKSTLIKILAGVVVPSSGRLKLDGNLVEFRSPAYAMQTGIAVVFQELSLFPEMSVAENILLGREPLYKWRIINNAKLMAVAQEHLNTIGCNIDPGRMVKDLSLSERQLVEIAKALSMNPRVLILDEATSALSKPDADKVLGMARKFRDTNGTVIFVSHRLDEVLDVADTITVLRDGVHIGTHEAKKLTRQHILTMMLGEELQNMFPTRMETKNGKGAAAGLIVRHLVAGERLHGVSLSLNPGEICGIAGLQGQGQGEVLQAIGGLLRLNDGTMEWQGRPYHPRNIRSAIRRGIVLVPEDRGRMALHQDLPIRDNLVLAIIRQVTRMGMISRAKECAVIEEAVKGLGIRLADVALPVRTLSGGNQQKVVLGKWLLARPSLLLLDDPTRGIDVGAKREFYNILAGLRGQNMVVLMSSSDIEELVGLCDRVLVMYDGKIVSEFRSPGLKEADILAAMFPREGESMNAAKAI